MWVGDAALQLDSAGEESAVLLREITAVEMEAPWQSWRGRQGRGLSGAVMVSSHPIFSNVLELLHS